SFGVLYMADCNRKKRNSYKNQLIMKNNFSNVNEYIAIFPEEVRQILEKIRQLVLKNAPQAIEGIAYQMPAYKLNKKPLLYFAAFKNHIGFYATPSGHSEFAEDLSKYKKGKGSV